MTQALDIHDFDLRTYRSLGMIGGVVITAFGFIQRMGHPEFVDSIPLRASVVALCFAYVAATHASGWARRHARDLAYALYVVVTLYSVFITFQNRFSADMLIGTVFTFAAISIAIRSPRRLLAYVAMTVAASVAITVGAHGVAEGGGTLLGTAVGFGAISYLLQRSRQDADERLAESEARFRALIEDSSELITVLAPDGTIRYDSPAVTRRLGYSQEERVGKSILDFLHPDDVPVAREVLRKPSTPLPPLELRGRHKDGSHRVFHCRAHLTTIGLAVTRITVISTDITARKRAEDEREALVRERESLIQEREHAIDQLKRLTGLLPVCAKCKRTRNDKGYWEQLDAFLEKNSDLQISHGLCPGCAKELYAEYLDEPTP